MTNTDQPSPYSCPTCDSTNPNLFIRCNHPECPDGRDQRRLDPPHWREPQTPTQRTDMSLSTALLIGLSVVILLAAAFALGKYL